MKELERFLIERVERDGPIDVLVTEEEYAYLIPKFADLWTWYSWWDRSEKLLALAFFRGYTFYRELPEDESSFWRNFHEELGLPNETPLPKQYDLLWSALTLDNRLLNLLQRNRRGRDFINTIDAVWGFRSLRARELVGFFTLYYLHYPGQRLTAQLMHQILPSADDSVLRQAAAFHDVFRSMTQAVDYILDNDLEHLPVDDLIDTLEANGLELGQPNCLRYFDNKSKSAVGEILARLRLQRTPAQFRRFLEGAPGRLFYTPTGALKRSQDLAVGLIPFGRYRDVHTGEEHHVTPHARISLNIIDRLPLGQFNRVAGLELFLAEKPFQVRIGDAVETSKPIYRAGGTAPFHIWSGRVRQGIMLKVGTMVHPGSVGIAAKTWTELAWDAHGPKLMGGLHLDIFEPEHPDLTLTIGNTSEVLASKVQGFERTFPIDPKGVVATLEGIEHWTWPWIDRLFSASGREIVDRHMAYGPKNLYLLTETPPVAGAGVEIVKVPGQLPLWKVGWDGRQPLDLGQWRIEGPFLSTPYRPNRRPTPKTHDDVRVILHDGYFEEDVPFDLILDEPQPRGTVLQLANQIYVAHDNGFRIQGLPQGKYEPMLVRNRVVVDVLEPIEVLPSLTWETAQDPVLIEGRTQAGRIILPDGRFASFRWKPRRSDAGEPLSSSLVVEVDELRFGFDIEGDCLAVRFRDPDTREVQRELPGLSAKDTRVTLINPTNRDFAVRARLASDPIRVEPLTKMAKLTPIARDQLSLEVQLDGRRDAWVPLVRIPIQVRPRIEKFSVDNGYCVFAASGTSDMTLVIEEFEATSNLTIQHRHRVLAGREHRIRLHHPYKFTLIFVRGRLEIGGVLDESLQADTLTPAIVDVPSRLRRGLAWSSRP